MLPAIARYSLILSVFTAPAVLAGDFTISDDGHRVSVADHGQPVVDFVYADSAATSGESDNGAYSPTHYFHPLVGLLGETVTGESDSVWGGPPGIHWGWSRLGVGGQLIDIEQAQGARRLFERWLGADAEGDEAVFALQSAWVTEPDGQARVVENMTITVYAVDGSSRYLDIAVLIRNVSDARIRLDGALPGSGLTVQLNSSRGDWALSSATGWLQPGDAPYLSPWTVCTYRDDRRSSRSGLAILQDSRNPAYSTPNWVVEDGYRVSAGAPESFKTELKPGGFLEFRYRIILFGAVGGGFDPTGEYAKFMGDTGAAN